MAMVRGYQGGVMDAGKGKGKGNSNSGFLRCAAE
jgi:hypothetical protein